MPSLQVMSDPYTELRRSLSFLLEGSSNSTAAAADVQLDPSDLAGEGGSSSSSSSGGSGSSKAGAPPPALVKAPGIVTHPASEEVLQNSQKVLRDLEALYSLHNRQLKALLTDMGQEHAMYNATHVFPDPWTDLGLGK
jgi:hypothetical protein